MTKYTSLQVSQGDLDFDRICHKRRHSPFPFYTCTIYLLNPQAMSSLMAMKVISMPTICAGVRLMSKAG